MRLFVAIELPETVRQHLRKMQEILRSLVKAKWIPPEQMHITLKFLGETPDERLPVLLDELDQIKMDNPISLSTSGPICFPPQGNIRIIAAALNDPFGQCISLQKEIDERCHVAGFMLEGRAWTPHVTLARVKDRIPQSTRATLVNAFPNLPPLKFNFKNVTLIESELDRSGPEYVRLATIPKIEK